MTNNIDNQYQYWDKVASQKEFTHPLDKKVLDKYFQKNNFVLDYGCGYGRIVSKLHELGFANIQGFDTSKKLIERGKAESDLPIFHINTPADLSIKNNSVDNVLLFAVLTCIPSNKGQQELLDLLYSKLKHNGILYLSDYYLQKDSTEMDEYKYWEDNKDNYGVFGLKEGVVFRHHTKEWIKLLLQKFTILEEKIIEVSTLNGNKAEAFQIVAKK